MKKTQSLSTHLSCNNRWNRLRAFLQAGVVLGLALFLVACRDKETVVQEGVAFYCEVDRLREALRSDPGNVELQDELHKQRERFEALISPLRPGLQIELQERIEARYQQGQCAQE